MKIALWTPLPPTRSGIAHYASMILPGLARLHDVTAVVATPGDVAAFERSSAHSPGFRVIAADEGVMSAESFDLAIYQLGNNPHHEFIYRQALRRAGLVVLHEVVLHHLIVEMTLARGDGDAYVETMRRNHGPSGAAWAEGRVAGLHGEIGNFLFPASLEAASGALAVIVHNEYARDRLRSFGVGTPIEVIGHPYVEQSDGRAADHAASREAVRKVLGAQPGDRLAGLFGFVTSAKRIGVVMEAFASAAARDPRLRLVIVGEPAPNIDLPSIAASHGVEGRLWTAAGYVAEESFDRYLDAVDCVVNLRYPTAGETSGALIRTFAAGRPVAVSQYAQFAEFPTDVATPIPLEGGEVESLTRFLLTEPPQPLASAQRRWLQEHCSLDATVAGYAKVIDSVVRGPDADDTRPAAIHSSMPLFPQLSVSSVNVNVAGGSAQIRLSLFNAGAATVRGRSYGEISYRIIAKLVQDGREIASRWVELPSDLAPGMSGDCEISLAAPAGALILELHHGIEEMENRLSRPWFRTEIP
jgi:glycosyltransferase involved in cell wall biosynthesis